MRDVRILRQLALLLAIALVAFSPASGFCETFTDDFNDPTTYLLPINSNTLWNQVGTPTYGWVDKYTDAGEPGDHAARLISTDLSGDWAAIGLAAQNGQSYDLSSAVLEADIRINNLGGAIGFFVLNDTGEVACGVIGVGLHTIGDYWYFNIGEGDSYKGILTLDYLSIPLSALDKSAFHTLKLEVVGDELTGTLVGNDVTGTVDEADRTWVVSGTKTIPIDVACAGVFVNGGVAGAMDASFDNFSLTAQPDNRHIVFQDVELATTDPGVDEVFPAWSRDGKKISYMRRDPAEPGSWNVYVQQIDPPGPPVQCTQNTDNVWIYSIPAFSQDYSHVIFTTRNPGGEVSIQRARADGTGGVETLLYAAGINYAMYDVKSNFNLLVGTKEIWGGRANIFAIELAADGDIPLGAEENLLTNFDSGEWGAWGAHLDATGDRIVFTSIEYGPPPRDSDIYVLNGVQAILAGIADAPIEYLADPRLVKIAGGPNFQATPRFSMDGSLVYHCEDTKEVFDVDYMEQNPSLPWLDLMQEAHWEIFAADAAGLADPIRLNYYRPYNQGVMDASPDGTKLIFVSDKLDDGDIEEDSDLYIVTLVVQERVKANKDTTLVDGSGTTLFVPANSLDTNTRISIKTPFPGDFPSPETLPGGLQNIALARIIDSEKQPATIDPNNPPRLTIHYTDDEISGLDELSLRIYVFNEDAVPPSWEALENCEVKPVENTVSAPLLHFSDFCVGGALAGTLPAVGSFRPPLTNEEDFALQDGTALPVKFDVRNPAGEFLPDEPLAAVITDPSLNTIAAFVRGSGSEGISVDPASEEYHFNLHSKNYGLLEGTVYTIVILWNDIPIGDIDFTVDYAKGVGRGKKK
jgi:hypothetical protein